MFYKTIISGQLEFGSAKSYEKVVRMCEQRVENFYRTSELLLKVEDVFDEETHTLNIPRLVTQATDKGWQNTMKLLDYIIQFAIAGDVRAWMVESGKVLKHKVIEPKSEKAAIQAYLRGRELVEEEGKEKEAKAALSSAIAKYERHARAYERRGYVNFLLQNFEEAIQDYTKSISINPKNPEPYLGRGIIKMKQNDLEGAVADMNMAIKHSIPLQPIHWKARRIKGECLLRLEDFANSAKELKFCTSRNYSREDSNYKWRQLAWFNYGKALAGAGQHTEAVQAFEQAIQIEDAAKQVPQEELLEQKEQALQLAEG